jgi:hypothetical protein
MSYKQKSFLVFAAIYLAAFIIVISISHFELIPSIKAF